MSDRSLTLCGSACSIPEINDDFSDTDVTLVIGGKSTFG